MSWLRRGEVAGLRWVDIHLESGTLTIRNNRAAADGRTVENDSQSVPPRRALPLPERPLVALRSEGPSSERTLSSAGCERSVGPRALQRSRATLCSCGLSRYWRDTVRAAGVRHIKLHAAPHTCATLMHLNRIPAAVIAAWIRH
ncbi:tyrosine-type recombinase/integrase [Mycolicibacterium mageritense]|uniref:tyrosine-type recombinase/integrase n=1 Tax=Mycolicibacterium mageritense TaxID=53462 RepID=UPI0009E0581B